MDNPLSADYPCHIAKAVLTFEQSGDWWWIGGETYSHRQILKTFGCRWSKRRQQWYYIGAHLPQAIRALAENAPTANQSVAQDQPGEAAPTNIPLVLSLHAHRIVTVGREYPGSKDYTWIVEGNPRTGEREILARHCTWLGNNTWRYIGESLPTALAEVVEIQPEVVQAARSYSPVVGDSARITPPASNPVPTAPAVPPAPPPRPPVDQDNGNDLLPAWLPAEQPSEENRFSASGERQVFARFCTPENNLVFYAAEYDKAGDRLFGYTILGGDLDQGEWGWQSIREWKSTQAKLGIQRDVSFQTKPLSEALTNYRTKQDQIDAPAESHPGDAAPATPTVSTRSLPRISSGTPLPQQYIGRVNVAGDCYCYGLVLDKRPPSYSPLPVYLSIAGPAVSVEAVWAKLALGKETTVVPDDPAKPAIYLQPSAAGLYKRFQKKIEALGIDHLILVHDDLAEPNYQPEPDDVPVTYVLCLSKQQKRAKLGEHVRKIVKVAVFDAWFDFLFEEGLRRGLVQDCIGYGLEAVRLTLDTGRWTTAITEGLAHKRLTLP